MTQTVGLGVIGAGGIARAYHLPALRHVVGAQLLIVADTHADRAKTAAEEFGIPRWSADPEAIFADSDVDAVLVLTHNSGHAPLAEAAAAAGKHVFVQKPMARSVAECEAMIRACEQAGVKLIPSYMFRYFPEVQLASRYMRDGYLGRIESVRLRNAPGGASLVARDYYRREIVGGGAVLDIGVHGIDLLRFLVAEIQEVLWAEIARTRDEIWIAGELVRPDNENLGVAVYRLANGARAVHEISWHQRTLADRFTLEIHGSDGSLVLRGPLGPLAISSARFGRGDDWVVPDLPAPPLGRDHHQAFVDTLAGRDAASPTGRDGLRAVEVVTAIYQTAAARSPWEG